MVALAAAFAARDLDRHYLALCWGLPSPGKGDIEGAIGRDPRDRKRMAIVGRGGRAALTHYRTVKTWAAAVSMVECRLATGRTHQIRVHLVGARSPNRRRSRLPAPHPRVRPQRLPSHSAACCWTSRTRRSTPQALVSDIRGQARR